METIKIENHIMVSRGVRASLDHVTAYAHEGSRSQPRYREAPNEWNEGNTWYPFAEEESGRRIPDDITEKAQDAANFTKRWVMLRSYYVYDMDITRGYYREIYFPPSNIVPTSTVNYGKEKIMGGTINVKNKMIDTDPARREMALNACIRSGESLLRIVSSGELSERKKLVIVKMNKHFYTQLNDLGIQRSDFSGNTTLEDMIKQLKQLRTPGKLILGSEG